jgi:arsenate reductase
MIGKLKILFLCTGNSCRSQMAEGFVRHMKNDTIEGYSAGVAPKGIDPRAIKAMAESGIDISRQKSTSLDELKHPEFDYVVTLCDQAHQSCPTFPGNTTVVHVGFDDPPKLAANARNEEEAMNHYRRIRDKIKTFVEELPEPLTHVEAGSSHQKQFKNGISKESGPILDPVVRGRTRL